ncbi:dynein assembly factor 4, axonemal [Nephila pilipes]|uniref:Dynein assembly factor 4, axonemal n=1 Tax=Nephila pilipes TaxID=299642 RepID=A0A8X6PEP4_NEPPI|nr:dynein assembly factor 4, axonemal [Nephila pilipes]
MPLIISEKDIKWQESINKILIIVPLSSRVDIKPTILITSKYLKISSPPYLWECFLFAAIDRDNSFVREGTESISFELQKSVEELWSNLYHSQAEFESYRKEQRAAAFEEHEKYLKESLEQKLQKKQDVQKESVRKQMELEELERKMIEKEKKLENMKVAAEIKRKKDQLKAEMIAQKRKHLLQLSEQIPPPRKSNHITVSFTPRVFPTAARESQEADEKEWLEKQQAASVSLKLDLNDLSPEERNPEWLKSKAESMLKKGDYKSAVNAYSLAIRMCPNLYSLYSGRSACHLNLRNLHKAIEDSSKALELLVPPVPSNVSARKEAHKIRGSAFQQLQLYVEGLMDFEAAIKLDGNDGELKKNAAVLRDFIEKDTEE